MGKQGAERKINRFSKRIKIIQERRIHQDYFNSSSPKILRKYSLHFGKRYLYFENRNTPRPADFWLFSHSYSIVYRPSVNKKSDF